MGKSEKIRDIEGEVIMKKNSVSILFRLIGLVKPLLVYMILAIVLGVLGFICANFLTVLATAGLLKIIQKDAVSQIILILLIFAFIRGFLRYGEQTCNHYIAFKLLALIRDHVFAALRKLAPAKLEGKDKGNLISIITSDIELLEVFYAHTISPVMIALLMSIIMMFFFGIFHPLLALYALMAYALVGIVIPLWTHYRYGSLGSQVRHESGSLSSFVLENLRGQKEIIQYDAFEDKLSQLKMRSEKLSDIEKKMKKVQAGNTSLSSSAIILLSIGMIALSGIFVFENLLTAEQAIIVSVAMFSSFSPYLALANLSSTIQPTIAAASRVLEILDEKPQIVENETGEVIDGKEINVHQVSFSYDQDQILKDVNLHISENEVIGIVGKSGSGKSTLLKLLMRFWDSGSGEITIDQKAIAQIETRSLRDHESYMTQKTHLFHDSILNNIKIAKLDATLEEVQEACKKASIHDFIMSLPKGYDTPVSECGDSLSGGEKQRIGLARAFLHDGAIMLLDEPTSNLDSLNEKIILKALMEQASSKIIILVSHRPSTISWCDRMISMENGRVS